MPSALIPIPSKGALKVLRQLAYVSSVGGAVIAEDRRRRLCSASEVKENAKRLRGSRRYHAAGTAEANPLSETYPAADHGDESRNLSWWGLPIRSSAMSTTVLPPTSVEQITVAKRKPASLTQSELRPEDSRSARHASMESNRNLTAEMDSIRRGVTDTSTHSPAWPPSDTATRTDNHLAVPGKTTLSLKAPGTLLSTSSSLGPKPSSISVLIQSASAEQGLSGGSHTADGQPGVLARGAIRDGQTIQRTWTATQASSLLQDMRHQISKGAASKAVSLYDSAIATGLRPTDTLFTEAVRARIAANPSDMAPALSLLESAHSAGRSVPGALIPILIHQMPQIPQHEHEQLQRVALNFYRVVDSHKLYVRHHVAVHAANVLLNKLNPDLALALLTHVQKSKWTQEQPFDIVGMTVFLRAYAATGDFRGILWVVQMVLDGDLRVDARFMDVLRRIRRAFTTPAPGPARTGPTGQRNNKQTVITQNLAAMVARGGDHALAELNCCILDCAKRVAEQEEADIAAAAAVVASLARAKAAIAKAPQATKSKASYRLAPCGSGGEKARKLQDKLAGLKERNRLANARPGAREPWKRNGGEDVRLEGGRRAGAGMIGAPASLTLRVKSGKGGVGGQGS